jgi:hypothetical protein
MHRGCIPKGGPTKSTPSARPAARHHQSAHRDGIQAGLAAALAGGRADRSCERCLFGSSATGGGRPERRSAIEVTDDLTVFDPELTGLPGGFTVTVMPRGERGDTVSVEAASHPGSADAACWPAYVNLELGLQP